MIPNGFMLEHGEGGRRISRERLRLVQYLPADPRYELMDAINRRSGLDHKGTVLQAGAVPAVVAGVCGGIEK